MSKLGTKSVLIYDHKLEVSLAECLARDFGKVMYHSPWNDTFPQKKNALIGSGLENVERVNNFWDHVDEADIIVFPWLGDGDIQAHLEDMGKKVWGSRRGDQLELNREGLMKLMKKLGLPVIDHDIIKGMDALREYIKSHKDIWVKSSKYRGDLETFHAVNYDYISTELDEIERELGAWKKLQKFLCEPNMPDCVEIGYDGYNIDGKFPDKTFIGLEVKDLGFVSKMTDYRKIPEPVLKFNDAITPYLKKWGYKGKISTETRINQQKVGFTTDITCREASPPGELMQLQFTNLPEIIFEGANGNCIDPIPKDKFGVELIIGCHYAEDKTLPVQFPEKYKENIKLKSYMKLDKTYYVIPGNIKQDEIGAIVATGDTLEEACDKAEEVASHLRASYIDIPFDALEKAQKELDKLKEFGYDIFK